MSKTKVEALNALCEKLGKTSTANTTVEALKNIYNALSGETSNADLISTAIDDITTVAEKPVEVIWSSGTVSKEVTSVTIPNGVTSVGDGAFKNYSSLTDITIPNGVTSIGNWVFEGCSNLANITIPNGVTSVGEYSFKNCSSLTDITIPNGVTSISVYTFSGCSSLTDITIPNGVTSVGNGAFHLCSSLANITIPDGVTSIGTWAFYGCSNLANIYYKGTEEQWNTITKGSDWNANMGSNVEGGTVITYNYTG